MFTCLTTTIWRRVSSLRYQTGPGARTKVLTKKEQASDEDTIGGVPLLKKISILIIDSPPEI
jgi:hypothetical protein